MRKPPQEMANTIAKYVSAGYLFRNALTVAAPAARAHSAIAVMSCRLSRNSGCIDV